MIYRVVFACRLRAVLFAAMLISAAGMAAERADNFVLLDHAGSAHELYYGDSAAAVLLVAHSSSCPLDTEVLQTLKNVQPELKILLINSTDSRAEIARAAAQDGIDLPILHDHAQIIAPSLGFDQVGDAVLVDTSGWQISYQGDVGSALLNELVAQPGAITSVQGPAPVGCRLNLPVNEQVADYASEIVPILQNNCMACHVEGGIGPWAMSEYAMIQGFAPMIREVVRVKRMPPWHADPAVGHWQHSAAMSDNDTQTLINWIEAGAPRGTADDPLLAERQQTPQWPLGEPDLMLEIPTFDIPATGVVDYQFPVVANPLDRDVWVEAATIVPGDTRVVHHVLMGSAEQAPAESDRESVFQNYIMGYAPGNESAHMPAGTGVFVPVGGVYQFQMHYTPVGVATTDTTRVALYFADEPPANFLRQQVVLNPRLKIPANTADHVETAYFEFWEDATIYSLVPHSHYRGTASTFVLEYPDGSSETILSVPNYDFNWQRTYSFVEPKAVPQGTRIVHSTVYDNSSANPANPDPEREVPWGLQSHDEMLYGSVSFSWDKERSDAPIHSNLTAGSAQFIGFMDKDKDGKLAKTELPDGLRKRLGWFKWWFVDTNFDGGLDLAEIEEMFSGN
ncbi:MAG: cytochrome c [Pseudomonadaceae bacterium]|nr:cytochrome c [Pseudomonadaceae bacterium]